MQGLVLEGGGAKGSYQIGAIKALYEMGYSFDGITGTSIGAINGAFLAQKDLETIYDIWEQGEISLIIDTDKKALGQILDFEFKRENISNGLSYLRKILNSGGLDITPLKKLLEDKIDEKAVRNSGIDYGLVTVNMSNLEPLEVFVEDIPEGELVKYIIASASLPIFQLERFNGKLFWDGGFFDNLPINLLASKGYKDIVVVETQGMGRKRDLAYDDLNITRIRPSEKISRTIEVDGDILRRNLKRGYLDAYKTIKNYAGKRYYIDVETTEKDILHFLVDLPSGKKKAFGKLFNIRKEEITNRKFFEMCLPILGKILKESEEASYLQLIVALHEKIADALGIDRLKIYTLEEMRQAIQDALNPNERIRFDENYRYIPFKYLPKEIDVLPQKTLNKIYKKIFKIFY